MKMMYNLRMINLTLYLMNCMIHVNLYDKFKKLSSKYSTSKKNRAYLLVEKKTLEKKVCIVIDNSNEINKLEDENKSLREKINKLNKTLAKFTQGSKIIETMLFKPNMCF